MNTLVGPDVERWFGHRKFTLRAGQLEECTADALVSSDDNYLSHGGGVSRALWRAAGEPLLESFEDARDGGPLALTLGDVCKSTSGSLRAKHLLHAITIDFDAGRTLDSSGAVALYGHVLDVCARLGAARVALPLFASGAARLPAAASVRALIEALLTREGESGAPSEVTLVVLPDLYPKVSSMLDAVPALAALADHNLTPIPHLPFERLALLQSLLEGLAAKYETLPTDPPTGTAALRTESPSSIFERILRSPNAGALESPFVAHVRQALRARNVVIHNHEFRLSEALEDDIPEFMAIPCDPNADAHHQLSRGLLALSRHLGPRAVSMDMPAAISSPPLPPSPPQESSPQRGRTASTPRAHTNDPARALYGFLLEHVPRSTLSRYVQLLRDTYGYRGEDDDCLLERCVSHDDPVALLAHFFSASELAAKRIGATEKLAFDAPFDDVARIVLAHLGFPVPERILGLHDVRVRLETLQRDAASADLDGLTGGVVNVAAAMETLLAHYLRFLCRWLFDAPVEERYRALIRGAESTPADGSSIQPGPTTVVTSTVKSGPMLADKTLGVKFSVLHGLAKELRKDPQGVRFAEEFRTRELLPAGLDTTEITRLRNLFAHPGRKAPDETIDVWRQRASRFCELTRALLDHFAGGSAENPRSSPRVFPYVLLVERVHIDRWGRRIVVGRNDEGQIERIFTADPLDPGSLYFMHPHSNPLRVDPLLGKIES